MCPLQRSEYSNLNSQRPYKGKPIRLTADFSTQTLNAKRSRKDVFQALKENYCQPRLVYPAKLYFPIEGETETFQSKEKLKNSQLPSQHSRKY
jgi:hypothetical protein